MKKLGLAGLVVLGGLLVSFGIVAAVLFLIAPGEPGAATVEGAPEVPAPGVLIVDGHWVHLAGARVPERDADCEIRGVAYQCALASMAKLAELAGGHAVHCALTESGRRLWGTCHTLPAHAAEAGHGEPAAGGHGAEPVVEAKAPVSQRLQFAEKEDGAEIDLGAELVRSGWALPDPQFPDLYAHEAEEAERAGAGLWAGKFAPAVAPVTEAAGLPQVVSAGVVEVGGQRMILLGIEAPEIVQTCRMNGLEYGCGHLARAALIALSAGRRMACAVEPGEGAAVARCADEAPGVGGFAAGAEPLGLRMIRAGWAVAAADAPEAYHAAEEAAHAAHAGLWAGEFVRPDEWRSGVRLAAPGGGGGGH